MEAVRFFRSQAFFRVKRKFEVCSLKGRLVVREEHKLAIASRNYDEMSNVLNQDPVKLSLKFTGYSFAPRLSSIWLRGTLTAGISAVHSYIGPAAIYPNSTTGFARLHT